MNKQLTSRDTTAALKRNVFPLLDEAGFTDGTPRSRWRHFDGRIAHIQISSFSPREAQIYKCSTASFIVRIALCLERYSALYDPLQRDYIDTGPDGPRPRESQMPIRGVICPGNAPPLAKGQWGWETDHVWRVADRGDADRSSLDLAEQLRAYALGWLDCKWDAEEILRLLRSSQPSPFLVIAANGSNLRLDAEMPGFPIRRNHIEMAAAELALQTE